MNGGIEGEVRTVNYKKNSRSLGEKGNVIKE